MRPALAAAVLLAVLPACGVKAPPRPSGAPEKEAPHPLFKPAEDPNRPSLDLGPSSQEPAR